MTRPFGTSAELERRRTRAVQLLGQGESPSTIARVLGVTPNSVHRWRRLAQADNLAARPHPGRHPRLSRQQLARLEQLLQQGATAHGWHNELWTAARVTKLIRDSFGVNFHPEHVRRILKEKLGWTSQRPRLRARERDDKEVDRWRAEELPRILRQAREKGIHVVFLDEAGFQLTPVVRRTFAPRGQTPVVRAYQRRKKISAISCVTLSPKQRRAGLFFRLLDDDENVRASAVVVFLALLRRQLRGGFIVVWDRSSLHSKSGLVKEWLAAHPDVQAEDFPGYAPELNPDEMVWSWTKYTELCNFAARDLDDLRAWVEDTLLELNDQPGILKAFIEHVVPLAQAA